MLNRPTLVVKIGGSALDLEELSSETILRPVAEHLLELTPRYNLVVVPGGGPSWDLPKVWNRKYSTKKDRPLLYASLAADILRVNALQLCCLFGDQAEVVPPERVRVRLSRLFYKDKIAILYGAARSVLQSLDIDAFASDAVTLAIAESLGTYNSDVRVVFLKDIANIRKFHPRLTPQTIAEILRDHPDMPKERQTQYEAVSLLQKNSSDSNPIIKRVAVEDLLTEKPPIYRIGLDGDDDHLIESSALNFLSETANHIDSVLVGGVRQVRKLESAIHGDDLPEGFGLFYRKRKALKKAVPADAFKPAVCIIDDDTDELRRCREVLGEKFIVTAGSTVEEGLSELRGMGRRFPDLFLVDLYFSDSVGDIASQDGKKLLAARVALRDAERKYEGTLNDLDQKETGFYIARDLAEDFGGIPVALFTRKGITQRVARKAFEDVGAVAVIPKPDPSQSDVEQLGLGRALDEAFRRKRGKLLEAVEKSILRYGGTASKDSWP